VAVTEKELAGVIECARCGGDIESPRRGRPCPHCGAKKADRCEVCAKPIYIAAGTCEEHRPRTVFEEVMPDTPMATGPQAPPSPAVPSPVGLVGLPAFTAPAPSRSSGVGTAAKVIGVLLAAVGLVLAGTHLVGTRVVFPDASARRSPARAVVKEPCARYRELSISAQKDGVTETTLHGMIDWVNQNKPVFDEAARLDPKLTDAAANLTWYQQVFNDPATWARTSMDDFKTHDKPITQACTTGPGQP
jgi:predicted RNA-binding Zn-ribbon protein involved in translation (DUF1610 family)